MDDKTLALLRSLFGKDENGKHYLRVVITDGKGLELKNSVNTQSNTGLNTLLKNSIVLDENGQPALSIATVAFGKTLEASEKERRAKMHEDRKIILEAQKEEQRKANKAFADKSKKK